MLNVKILFIFLFVLLFLNSCKKKEEHTCGTCSVGGAVEPTGFTYTKNGGAQITADSAFFYPASNTIISFYQGVTHRVIIKTSSQATGSYSISTSASNKVFYYESVGTYGATGGNVNITSNANNLLSGNFTTNGTGGGFISIGGQFKDIKKR
jgi:hypothetical protein